ncbi:MAG: carbohydrate ABC transporter permease [Clostridia bacterium]|nr:carbohydrate ABC transporter permease [Clostridia bacterium]
MSERAINETDIRTNNVQTTRGEKIGSVIIHLVILLFALGCLLPVIMVVIVSLTEEKSITLYGYSFIPHAWSAAAYKMMFGKSSAVPRSYLVTTATTVIGTFFAAIITFGAGYTLANKQCRYRNGLSLYFYFTMVFSAGLVPWYMVSKMIGAYDNMLALIVPSLMFSPFNMFLVRNFVNGIPDALNESARIDGAGEVRIAFQIYFPLCKAVLATITLFYAIGYWNNYFNAVMLINDRKYYPLQMLLFQIQSEITAMSKLMNGAQRVNPPKEAFKMATSVVTMGPIILLYPFLQKYFVKGMVIGAVKG